jgi:hypothetical protein
LKEEEIKARSKAVERRWAVDSDKNTGKQTLKNV